jgi:4-amino-4-deoxy-L-arabinose transferase-like glycosyltransferase
MVPPFDQQVGWFLPLALLCLVWLLVRRPGSRATRAAVHVLGGWLLVLTVLFSAMGGAMHPYYTALLAPAIAAVMAIGLVEMWRAGSHRLLAGLLGLAIGVGAVIQLVAGWTPWLPGVAVAGGLVAVAALWRAPARVPVPAVVVTVLALAIGPVVTHAGTLSHPVVGADPHAGWVIGDRTDPYPDDLLRFLQRQQDVDWVAAVPQATPAAVLSLQLQRPVLPLSGFTGTGAGPTVEQLADFVQAGRLRYAVLLGRYTTHPTDTPPSLQGSRLARTIDWAREHGCPSQVGTYTVIDLSHGSCRPAGGN